MTSVTSAVSRHTQTDTRQLILRIASQLLLTRSYLGLSFQDLADLVGIRKASLYHHFASKEVLGVALVHQSQRRFVRWTEGVAHLAPADQMLAYLHMFRDQIGAGDRVCPLGAFGGEWDCIEPELQAAVRGFHQTQMDWLTQAAAAWQAPSPGTPGAAPAWSAAQWAAHVNTVCQGAMINARIHDDVARFDEAVAPLQSQLQARR